MKFREYSLLLMALALTTIVRADDTDPRRIGPNAVLTFETNRTTLTQNSKGKLNALIKEAKATGEINEVQVAAWSDNPAPRPGEELSSSDRALAEKRGNIIHDYLKGHCKVNVESYNMADRAGWLARSFETGDAELKSEIGKSGDSPMSRDEFQIFKNNGFPSKAVVLVIMKHSS